jgi:hypothetical protein
MLTLLKNRIVFFSLTYQNHLLDVLNVIPLLDGYISIAKLFLCKGEYGRKAERNEVGWTNKMNTG